jgi:hypothetical protein
MRNSVWRGSCLADKPDIGRKEMDNAVIYCDEIGELDNL